MTFIQFIKENRLLAKMRPEVLTMNYDRDFSPIIQSILTNTPGQTQLQNIVDNISSNSRGNTVQQRLSNTILSLGDDDILAAAVNPVIEQLIDLQYELQSDRYNFKSKSEWEESIFSSMPMNVHQDVVKLINLTTDEYVANEALPRLIKGIK